MTCKLNMRKEAMALIEYAVQMKEMLMPCELSPKGTREQPSTPGRHAKVHKDTHTHITHLYDSAEFKKHFHGKASRFTLATEKAASVDCASGGHGTWRFVVCVRFMCSTHLIVARVSQHMGVWILRIRTVYVNSGDVAHGRVLHCMHIEVLRNDK